MHVYTHRPWLATPWAPRSQMSVCGSNEYWISWVISFPFCLMLPSTLPSSLEADPTLFLQMATFGPPGVPKLSSRKDFPIINIAVSENGLELWGQKSDFFFVVFAFSTLKLWLMFLLSLHRSCGSCCHEMIKIDNNCKSVLQLSAIWQLHQFDW